MKQVLSLLLCIYAFAKAESSNAQSSSPEKIEREYRIDEAAVPEEARDFIASYRPTTRVKWIYEESAKGASVEAKFKDGDGRQSIEFTPEGELEDIEVVVDWGSVQDTIESTIKEFLKKTFDYYKVEKIQEQYVERKEVMLAWRHTKKDDRTLRPKYELIVKSRNSGEKSQRYEFLFDEDGNFVEKAKVVTRSDNILRF